MPRTCFCGRPSATRSGRVTQGTEVDRSWLYGRIWSSPMRAVAEELGISDVALAKIARSSMCHGRHVATGLRSGMAGASRRLHCPGCGRVCPNAWSSTEPRPSISAADASARIPPTVPVPEAVSRFHPLVQRTEQALGISQSSARGLPSRPLSVAVSTTAAKRRAVRLLDALVKALEKRGHKVEVVAQDAPPTFVVIGGERVHFRLRELSRQLPRDRRSSSACAATRQRGDERRYTELVPCGELMIELTGAGLEGVRRRWSHRSRKNRRLEILLGELVAEFEVAGDLLGRQREEERRAAVTRERQAAEDERERQRRAHREALEADFVAMATRWARAGQLREFLDAARSSVAEAGLAGADVDAWFVWARAYAARLDPLSTPHRIAKQLAPLELPRYAWGAPTSPVPPVELAVRPSAPESNRGET